VSLVVAIEFTICLIYVVVFSVQQKDVITSKLDWMQQPAKAKGFLVVTTGFFCQFFWLGLEIEHKSLWTFFSALLVALWNDSPAPSI
jgi:CDP-diglyceride synthetase